ncbi:transcription initiation factor TFIID subunit 12 [Histomonas meleagridis]|uniref:transcription initiation factor TFIID subunit 12 n=1 Tax=Histomonas meleagridis TaxID=135588 RepID=UPI00355A978B|nr:transcription initiation factor TFIID subunit 12 [Histomonas meleagridis]KAH0802614.1 transcription initiation factor TFIID subunit 12 [Histomonas meleagridis]
MQHNHTAFDDEMDRAHLQTLIDSKPDITREYTITDLLHKIDPSASLDPLAEELLLDIADDFIDSIVNLAVDFAKNRKSETIQAEDVNYIIQRKFENCSFGPTKGIQRQPDFVPNEAHLKRIKAIQESIQNEQQQQLSRRNETRSNT